MVGKPVNLPQRFGLLHHDKQIEIRPIFRWSPLTLCIVALSLNLILKQCDNNTSGSSQSTYLWKNEQFNHQQWYQQPRNFEHHVYGIFTHSTEFIQYRHKQGGRKNSWFTAVVRPNSLCQKNQQTTGLSVLTSYLCLISLMWLFRVCG